MQAGSRRAYIISLILILGGVSVSAYLLTGPLKEPAGALSREKSTAAAGKVYELVLLGLLVYSIHLAARFFSDKSWRKRDAYAREVRWTGLDVLAMALLLVTLQVAYGTFFGSPSESSGEVRVTTIDDIIGGLVSYGIVLLFGIYVLRQRGASFADVMGLRSRQYKRLIVTGIIAFLVFKPLHMIYQTGMLSTFYVLSLPIKAHPVVEDLVGRGPAELKLALALSVGLSAPFFEEVFFRGFLYQAIRRRTYAWGAVVLTAMLFASIHPGAFLAVQVFPLGMMLAYLMEKTGSLIPCMVVHLLVNGESLLGTFLID
jgi:membrane protease YdiL (CAAX protease family)